MGLYIRKVKPVEAYQFKEEQTPEWDMHKTGCSDDNITLVVGDYGFVKTKYGTLRAKRSDFIILGLDGKKYVCPAGRFLKDFEEVFPAKGNSFDNTEKLWDNICDSVDKEEHK